MSDAESVNRLHQAHTLSPETRRALLASSLSTTPDRRDRWPFRVMGALLVVGLLFLVLAW